MKAVFAPLLAMLIVTSTSAQEKLNLSYRGVSLGDTPEYAYTEALKNFEMVRLDKQFEELEAVLAGDKAGMRDISCPYAAPLSRRLDCQRVNYVLNQYEGKLQVTYISVKQSFRQALPMDAFMSRIKDTYGKPRAKYLRDKNPNQAYIDKDQSLLWGGKNTPPAEFSISGYPYGDSERVGGKHILMRVLSTPDGVIGYELRISDHDQTLKREAERKEKNIDAAEAAKKDNINKLKF